MSTLTIDSPATTIVGYFLIVGAGTALFATPNQSSILGAAPPGRLGTVSALISTTRNIGLIAGLATAEAIFTAYRQRPVRTRARRFTLPVSGRGGLRPGVDLDSNAGLEDVMEDRE